MNKCEQSGIIFHDALDVFFKEARRIFKGKSILLLLGDKHPTLVEHYIFKFEVKCLHCHESITLQWTMNPKGEILINTAFQK